MTVRAKSERALLRALIVSPELALPSWPRRMLIWRTLRNSRNLTAHHCRYVQDLRSISVRPWWGGVQ